MLTHEMIFLCFVCSKVCVLMIFRMFCLSSSERVEGAGGKTAKAKWIPKPSWAKKREPKYLIMDVITNIVIICHGNAELASATSVVDLAKVVFLFLPCLTPTYSLSLSLSLSLPSPSIHLPSLHSPN